MIKPLKFNEKNIELIADIEKECFKNGAINNWVISPFLLNGCVFGFFYENKFAGACEIIRSFQKKENIFLFSFMLNKKYRGKNLSKIFLKELFEYFSKENYEYIYLTVSEKNIPAWKLYNNFNFQKEKFIENIYGKNEHRWLIYKKIK